MMSLLELKNVSLSYSEGFSLFSNKKKVAIDNLCLSIRTGENVAVLGGNGAGKSTLLKLLAGIYRPSSGEMLIHKPYRPVFVGLQSGFVPYMDGQENVVLTGMLLGMSKKEIKKKLPDIFEYAELGSAINNPTYTYSAGMRARLAFAISVYSEPDLLLIDEAMGVGDKDFRKKSNETIKQMIEGHAAVVIVSHEMKYLREVCDQAVWFENGKVKALGSSESVINEYESV